VPYRDPEKRREFMRKWRAANRDKLRKASLKWRTANLDKVRETNRSIAKPIANARFKNPDSPAIVRHREG
jgi:hypothetical protein